MAAGQHSDDYSSGAPGAECSRRFITGRAGGQNIIHQQDDLAAQSGPGARSKSPANVFFPLVRRLRRLLGSMANAPQPSRPARQSHSTSQAASQRLTLIVAAPEAPPPMQWNRNDYVRANCRQSMLSDLRP